MAEQGDKNTEISDSDRKMDALMDAIRDACTKMDEGVKRLDARMDAFEERERADSARRDAEDAEREKGEPKEPVGDRKDAEDEKEEKREDRKDAKEDERERKDSEKEDEKEEKREDRKDARKDEDDEAMADAAPISRAEASRLRAQIADLHARAPAIISDADRERFAVYQEQADPAFQAFGDRAPAPLQGETPLQYKRRLGTKLQGHSQRWKDARLSAISDDAVLDNVVGDIYADAIGVARKGLDVPPGQLREVVNQSGGHTIISFEGDADSWMNQFAGNSQRGTGNWMRPH